MAAEANAAKLQKKFQTNQNWWKLNYDKRATKLVDADIPLHGSLPDINSFSSLSLAEEAKNKKLLERDQRLGLGREQQAKREKEKNDMYFWRKNT